MSEAGMSGRCLCGAVTIRIGSHEPEVGACHCTMCRRWSGSAYFAFTAKADETTIEGPVKTYRSSEFAERAFCGTCGSHLWFRDDGDDIYELMPGLFDGARDFPLVSVVYDDRQPSWLPLSGEYRRTTAADYEARKSHVPD